MTKLGERDHPASAYKPSKETGLQSGGSERSSLPTGQELVRGIIDYRNFHGVDIRTATDFILGPDMKASTLWGTVSDYIASKDNPSPGPRDLFVHQDILDKKREDAIRTGRPLKDLDEIAKGMAAKALVIEDAQSIVQATEKVELPKRHAQDKVSRPAHAPSRSAKIEDAIISAYENGEITEAELNEDLPETISPEGQLRIFHVTAAEVFAKAESIADEKEEQGRKPDGPRLSVLNATGGTLHANMAKAHAIDEISVAPDTQAEVVLVVGGPLGKWLPRVNPDGGIIAGLFDNNNEQDEFDIANSGIAPERVKLVRTAGSITVLYVKPQQPQLTMQSA